MSLSPKPPDGPSTSPNRRHRPSRRSRGRRRRKASRSSSHIRSCRPRAAPAISDAHRARSRRAASGKGTGRIAACGRRGCAASSRKLPLPLPSSCPYSVGGLAPSPKRQWKNMALIGRMERIDDDGAARERQPGRAGAFAETGDHRALVLSGEPGASVIQAITSANCRVVHAVSETDPGSVGDDRWDRERSQDERGRSLVRPIGDPYCSGTRARRPPPSDLKCFVGKAQVGICRRPLGQSLALERKTHQGAARRSPRDRPEAERGEGRADADEAVAPDQGAVGVDRADIERRRRHSWRANR